MKPQNPKTKHAKPLRPIAVYTFKSDYSKPAPQPFPWPCFAVHMLELGFRMPARRGLVTIKLTGSLQGIHWGYIGTSGKQAGNY